MSNRKRNYLIFFLAASVFFPSILWAASHYIREGAAGKQDGSDWENAHTQLPPNLVRGDTYYITDGTYPGYMLTIRNPARSSLP
jgi:hypothetical protein